MSISKKFFGGCLAAILLATAGVASATSITYNFTVDNCTGGCGASPYGYVMLTENGTGGVDFLVHLYNGNSFVSTGAGDFMAFKFNGTGVVVGDISVNSHTPALTASTGSFNGDGGGLFAFGIGCPSCGNGANGAFTADILFTVATSTIADFTTTKNNAGNFFCADILGGGNTGLVCATSANPPDERVPEPGTLALLGLGMLGLGMSRRRAKA
jgi:hypothetical protein